MASIPGSRRSPGGGHGSPLQYSCLKNPYGQRSLVGCSLWGCKDLDTVEPLSMHPGISEVVRVQCPWWINVLVRTGRETRRFSLSLCRWWRWAGRGGGAGRGAVYLLEDNAGQLPTLWKIHFCWLGLPVYDILLRQLKPYKTEEERHFLMTCVCKK